MNTLLTMLPVLAEGAGSGTTDVGTIIGNSAQTAATQMTGVITTMLPIILSVLGVSVAVQFGLKWFRKIKNA